VNRSSMNTGVTYRNFLFIADGFESVRVMNISSPLNPTFLTQLTPNGTFYDIYVNQNQLYLLEDEGVAVYDILVKPFSVNLVDRLPHTFVSDLTFYDNILYLGDRVAASIIVYNVSDSSSIVKLSEYPNIKSIQRVSAFDGILVIYDSASHNLTVFNSSNLTELVQINSFDSDFPTNMILNSTFLYVGLFNGLLIYDLLNPLDPSVVGSYNVTSAHDLTLNGSLVYTVDWRDQFTILNVSDKDNIVVVESVIDPTESLNSVVISNSTVYTLNTVFGLGVYDLTTITSANFIGGYNPESNDITDITVNGDLLFALSEGIGIFIYNVSNPKNPVYISRVNNTFTNEVAVLGDLLIGYVSADFVMYNVSDPTNPTYLGTSSLGTNPYDFGLIGNSLFMVDGSQLLAINITDSATAVTISTFGSFKNYQHLLIHDKVAYVSDTNFQKIIAVNVTDPTNMTELWSHDVGAPIFDFIEHDNNIYFGSGNGIFIFDGTNETHYDEITSYDDFGQYAHLYTFDDILVGHDKTFDFVVLNASDITNLVELASVDLNIPSLDFHTPGFYQNYTFVPAQEDGISIFGWGLYDVPPPTTTSTTTSTPTSNNQSPSQTNSSDATGQISSTISIISSSTEANGNTEGVSLSYPRFAIPSIILLVSMKKIMKRKSDHLQNQLNDYGL